MVESGVESTKKAVDSGDESPGDSPPESTIFLADSGVDSPREFTKLDY